MYIVDHEEEALKFTGFPQGVLRFLKQYSSLVPRMCTSPSEKWSVNEVEFLGLIEIARSVIFT